MNPSYLVLGLSNEERASALHQVSLWDSVTVAAGLRRALFRGLRRNEYARRLQGDFEIALEDGAQCASDFNLPLYPQAMKLCRLLDHLGVPIAAPPTAASLHVDGEKVERKAIAVVRVKSVDDLMRYALCRLFKGLDARLSMGIASRTRACRQTDC